MNGTVASSARSSAVAPTCAGRTPSSAATCARWRSATATLDDADNGFAVERADDLVDGRRRPDAEERRGDQGAELAIRARGGLFGGLACAGRANVVHHDAVLVVDGRVLDEVVQRFEVAREERAHRDRLPGFAALVVEERANQVGVRRLG